MKIVICGSMSVYKKMAEIKILLTEKGHEVILPKNVEEYVSGDMPAENKKESTKNKIEHDLIRRYYSIIKEADAVLVLNYDKGDVKNYIGGNSFLEAGFAHVSNKKVYFLNDIPNMIYTDELRALQPVVLNGDLEKIK